MHLDKSLRVLTVGDGDLTFSYSLSSQHKLDHLTASVLDSRSELSQKYSNNALEKLSDQGVETVFNLDITDTQTFPQSCRGKFDLTIFQFPLIPNAVERGNYERKKHWGSNGQNRVLLFKFLRHSFEYLLDPKGARLAYISSKDVKPYSDWDIENLHQTLPNVYFLGWDEFDPSEFPDYTLRNVDRDKHVKSTSAKTYVWSDNVKPSRALNLNKSVKHKDSYCPLCGKGPFYSAEERGRHEQSRRHIKLNTYDANWQSILEEMKIEK